MSEWLEFRCEMLGWLCIATVGGILIVCLRFLRPGIIQDILPAQRYRLVTWGGLEVAILAPLVFPLPAFVLIFLLWIGFFRWLYGPDYSLAMLNSTNGAAKLAGDIRVSLWATVLATPIRVAVILQLLRVAKGVMPYQLGLTAHRWHKNIILGYLWWLVLTPVVLALGIAVGWMYQLWRGEPPEGHPLQQLFLARSGSLTPSEWFLILVTALIAAPVFEELFFRGVVQQWVTRRSWGGDLTIAVAFIFALFGRVDEIKNGMQIGYSREALSHLLEGFSPALFVLALIPGYTFIELAAWRWFPTPYVARGVYGTSALFALAHVDVWPSPIPLFFLALGLGFLAHRTQSLIGPITVHCLFNGVACLALIFLSPSMQRQSEKGNEATSAIRCPPSSATSSFIPGASWPRRTYPSATMQPKRGEMAAEVMRPTALPSWHSLLSVGMGPVSSIFNPRSDQFTCPRSRARTIGS